MATSIPAQLKAADINRFALRSAQLQTAKPVISYWCDYWIARQILGKGLHNADEECLTYTTTIMDKLEQIKQDNAENEAVTDDIAGKAYVEQFGLETFQRADNAVRVRKVTRQTADTFSAAATFLDLLQIWGEVDPEISAKIKYAKFHALRIAKALKAGEDPNPPEAVQDPTPTEEDVLPALDPNDPEVQMLNGAFEKPRQPSIEEVPDEAHPLQRSLAARSSLNESLHPSRASSIPRPPNAVPKPRVEEVPDEADRIQRNLARQSSLDESLHPSRAPSIPRQGGVSPVGQDAAAFYSNTDDKPDISPIEPTEGERKASIGGNYFPQTPSQVGQAPSQRAQLDLPSAPPHMGPDLGLPSAPPVAPSDFYPPPPDPQQSSPPTYFIPPNQPIPPNLAPQSAPRQQRPEQPPQLRQPTPMAPNPAYAQPAASAAAPPRNIVVDEESIMKAQKHARWAISALNFEDVPTAIKELQGALESLGGR